MSWQREMKDGYWLGKDHPGVYLGERQALNEDYTYSGYDRGHLNPNGHHAGHRDSTNNMDISEGGGFSWGVFGFNWLLVALLLQFLAATPLSP